MAKKLSRDEGYWVWEVDGIVILNRMIQGLPWQSSG